MKLQDLFERKAPESSEFKTWFGNSKVLDADGEPMVVYHATSADIRAFKVSGQDLMKSSGAAIWVTPHAHYQAAMHNIKNRNGFKDGVNVMPLYAKIEKPLVIDDKVSLDWAREVFAGGSKEFPHLMLPQWVDEVTKDGEYDGIIFKGVELGWGENSDEIVVFSPKQLKSAIGNNGKYSIDADEIDR